MIRSKDDFLDQRASEFNDDDALFLRMRAQEEAAQQGDGALPIIDLNVLKPEQATTNLQFEGGGAIETVDLTSMLIADKIVNAVVAGKLDPLVFMVKKKLIEDALEIASKNPDVKAMVATEVAKYGKEGAKILGATITTGSRKKYNYTDDPTWLSYDEQCKPYTEAKKAQEKLIQAAVREGKDFEEVDKETGEVKMIARCVGAPATDYIAVTFKNKR
jgi:hypothetical protein